LRLFPWHRRQGSHVPHQSLIELRAAYTPDAARSVSGHPPSLSRRKGHPAVLTSPNPLSTLQKQFACARLSRSCLPGSSSRRFRDAHDHGLYERGSVNTPLFSSSIFLFDLGAHLFVPTLSIRRARSARSVKDGAIAPPEGLVLGGSSTALCLRDRGQLPVGLPSTWASRLGQVQRQDPWLVR
jgi:hypothetical protein